MYKQLFEERYTLSGKILLLHEKTYEIEIVLQDENGDHVIKHVIQKPKSKTSESCIKDDFYTSLNTLIYNIHFGER